MPPPGLEAQPQPSAAQHLGPPAPPATPRATASQNPFTLLFLSLLSLKPIKKAVCDTGDTPQGLAHGRQALCPALPCPRPDRTCRVLRALGPGAVEHRGPQELLASTQQDSPEISSRWRCDVLEFFSWF